MNNYPRQSVGHVLQALRDLGVPENIAGTVTLAKNDQTSGRDRIFYHDQLFAEYKYFEGIEQPLFCFHSGWRSFAQQKLELQEDGSLKPLFRLSLGIYGETSFVISGHDASPQLHKFIHIECLTNWIDRPGYKLTYESGAFFQAGHDDPNGEYIYIEFWKPKGAQAFVDFINANYKPQASRSTVS